MKILSIKFLIIYRYQINNFWCINQDLYNKKIKDIFHEMNKFINKKLIHIILFDYVIFNIYIYGNHFQLLNI